MGINNWPKTDRPREKLIRDGEHTLSDSELLAIILGTGRKGYSALDLARMILQRFRTFRQIGQADLRHWGQLKGLGKAKVSQIKAAIEIARRFNEEKIRDERVKIESSGDVARMLMPRMQDLKKEVFKVLFLNSQNRVIDLIEIEEGSVNQARPIIREIYHQALLEFASFIVCVHNHPSGNPEPSSQDKQFTRELVLAGECLFIKCLDHVIIGNGEYFSFSDKGIIR
ncbi:MAG: DNA repair protein RadC [Candidatus Omnitrophica bacterium]|jgi:DNA repair protein RadC|nr:DNA repair protein RadC [Candidatus Omnitrophota bacterium]